MAGLSSALAEVVARFAAVTIGGKPLRVFTDPNDVTPPCVFVPLPDLAFRFAGDRARATWSAFVVGPNAPAQTGTVENIATVLDAVAGLFPYTEGELFTLTLPGGGPAAQSYRLTWLQTMRVGGTEDG